VAVLPPTFLTMTLGKVFFPLYSAVRGSEVRLREALAVAMHYVSIVMLPATTALLFVAPDVLVRVFGAEWAAARTLLQVLAAYALFRALTLAGNLLIAATGRPHLLLPVEGTALAVAAALLWPLSRFGAPGIAVAFTVGQAAAAGYALSRSSRLFTPALLREAAGPATAAAAATLAALAVDYVAPGVRGEWLQLLTFVVCYCGVLATVDRRVREIGGAFLGRNGPTHHRRGV